jgi:hypothetical protein
MLQSTTTWDAEWLQNFRSVADPVADDLVKFIENQSDFTAVHELFHHLVRNTDIPKSTQDPLNAYFKQYSVLPDWADKGKMALAQQIFAKHGPAIASILLFKALPACYACGNGARILNMTGRLTATKDSVASLSRRLMETSQFVTNVMAPGAFEPNGTAVLSILKVRLMHASIRYYILKAVQNAQDQPDGRLPNIEVEGLPINQEDMAGTFLSFSIMITRGLKQLGIVLSDAEERAFLHNWRVVSHMIGLDMRLLPEEPDDAWNLGVAIMKHQVKETSWGKELVASNFDFIHSLMEGNLFDGFPEFFTSFFLQDIEAATGMPLRTMLDIKSHDDTKDEFILKLIKLNFKFLDEEERKDQIFSRFMEHFNMKLLSGMQKYMNNEKQALFEIPPALRGQWDLEDAGDMFTRDRVLLKLPFFFGLRLQIVKKINN